jgi:Ca-activated chloride channel family protein
MFETFTLGDAYFLLLLPLFMLLHYFRAKDGGYFYMPHTKLLSLSEHPKNRLATFLKWSIIVSAVFAVSNPIYYKTTTSVKYNAMDIVLALDTSGSMSMYGFNPDVYTQSRLDVTKEVVSKFMTNRTDDRIGLVAFGTHASILSPLSFDKNAQKYIVKSLQIGSLGKSTALVDALVSAAILFKNSQSHSKVLIVLSDGEDSSSLVPLPIALKLLKKYGIKVYTVIIDQSASDMMKIIAKASQTIPYYAKNKNNLTAVYTDIDKLEKSKLDYMAILVPQPLYMYFLGLSVFTVLLHLFMRKNAEVW